MASFLLTAPIFHPTRVVLVCFSTISDAADCTAYASKIVSGESGVGTRSFADLLFHAVASAVASGVTSIDGTMGVAEVKVEVVKCRREKKPDIFAVGVPVAARAIDDGIRRGNRAHAKRRI